MAADSGTYQSLRIPGRYFKIVLFILVLIGLTFSAEQYYLNYTRSHWEAVQFKEEEEIRSTMQERFHNYQKELLDPVEEFARLQDLHQRITELSDSNPSPIFDILRDHCPQNATLELYDRDKELVAWSGRSGGPLDTSHFIGHNASYIVGEALYSYLVVVVPIPGSPSDGYVVGKKTFDVNYPINNRFVNNRAVTESFNSQIELSPKYILTNTRLPQHRGNQLLVELRGIDGSLLGYASVDRPVLPIRLSEIESSFRKVMGILFIFLFGMFGILLVRVTRTVNNSALQLILVLIALWLMRFVFLWAGFPTDYFHSGVFDPNLFSSPLAFGLVKNVGEFFITSIFLLVTAIASTRTISNISAGKTKQTTGFEKLVRVVEAVALVALYIVIIRFYFQSFHGIIFNSSLPYKDPMFVIPPFGLSVMLASLLAVTITLVLGFVFIINAAIMLLRPLLRGNGYAGRSLQIGSWRSILAGCGISIVLVLYLLDLQVHESDEKEVEAIASEMVQPIDVRLSGVVNKAVDELARVDANFFSPDADTTEVEKLAFTGWAKSVLSTEGYNCWVMYVNSNGQPVSDFHLGLVRHTANERMSEPPPRSRTVQAGERTESGEIIKMYTAYSPVYSDSGNVVGGVWLEISADRQALLGGEAPDLLRNYLPDKKLYRTLILSEYDEGRLSYTSSDNIGKDYSLPQEVVAARPTGVWVNERIDGTDYESFFLPQRTARNDLIPGGWLAISMETLDFRWHMFSILRLVFFYLLLLLLVGAMYLVAVVYRKGAPKIGFREKLLAAFVIVSILPIGILAYYNRTYAIERSAQSVIESLRSESDAVVTTIERLYGINAPIDLAKLQDEQCGEIANDLGVDFSVYAVANLSATSKPELYTAELFDKRLDASAFIEIGVRRKGFFAEQQSIGGYSYIVGYRPLLSEAGEVIAIVSIPTLNRQPEVDTELMQRNAFLFGAYALAMIVSIGIGLLFANQISSPLLKLREATRRVAAGDLTAQVSSNRTDELGELEAAFNAMTSQLSRTQQEMFRAQRELAWREMAKQVAHEIKNPLTPIKLSVQHLRQAYADGAKDFGDILNRVSSTILGQIEGLARIASEFSHFGRMPDRKIERCDIHEILMEAERLFEQEKGVAFESRLMADRFTVFADREELRRAFVNIMKNAVQALGADGKIAIETSSDLSQITIRIRDNGKGIPPEYRDKIFEPNFSTKTDGMGLGLAIVKKTIDDLKGTIAITSSPGRGTTVELSLPLAEENTPGPNLAS
jgi:signal transduction histidine kinase